MCRVWLIRHCQPDMPPGSRMCLGSTDLPLSAEGHRAAAALAAQFCHIPLMQVFCSPLQRSIQTAQALTDRPIILPGLAEQHMGQWDGLTFDEIRHRFPHLYEARGQDPTLLPPDSEPHAHALTRFQTAMEEAAARATGDFAVVAHGGVISLFLAQLTGTPYKPACGEVIPLQYRSDQFHMFSPID